jgi:hypothetical protein
MYPSESDDDGWDDFDEESNDETEIIRCPNCGADVYEDAEQCPSCLEYITTTSSIWSDRPWWWVALGLAGIIAVILALSAVGMWG